MKLTVVALALLLAGCGSDTVQASPLISEETMFVVLMSGSSLDLSDPVIREAAFLAVDSVCQAFDVGTAYNDIATITYDRLAGVMSTQDIVALLGGGVYAFCPEHLHRLPHQKDS